MRISESGNPQYDATDQAMARRLLARCCWSVGAATTLIILVSEMQKVLDATPATNDGQDNEREST